MYPKTTVALCGELPAHQWAIQKRLDDEAWWREFHLLVTSAELYDAAVDRGPVENF